MHPYIQGMGLYDKEDVKILLLRAGCVLPPEKPIEPYVPGHRCTQRWEGETRERRCQQLAVNESFILGLAMRGLSSETIACAFVVTSEAINKRLRKFGLSLDWNAYQRAKKDAPNYVRHALRSGTPAPKVLDWRVLQKIHAEPAQEETLIVEI